ncbi:putative quinol monooxygenase [Pseudomonas sp. MBLB4123]|uniref:putative quinol monooxygenase n=1 Tax=Pseudomonas sp. MBLB4123 TaxID=3451557 RepID=UPI003F755A0C
MPAPLTLVATIGVQDGQADTVEAGLRLLVAASRAEAGCLQYDLHRHRDNPRVFVMLEQWHDAAALAAHQRSAHYLAFTRHYGQWLQNVDLQLMQRIA